MPEPQTDRPCGEQPEESLQQPMWGACCAPPVWPHQGSKPVPPGTGLRHQVFI